MKIFNSDPEYVKISSGLLSSAFWKNITALKIHMPWTLIHDKIRGEIVELNVLEAIQTILKFVCSCLQVTGIGKKLI